MSGKLKIAVGSLSAVACFFLFQNCGGTSGFTSIKQNSSLDTLTTGGTSNPGGGGQPIVVATPQPISTGVSALLQWQLPSTTQASSFLIEAATDGQTFTTIAQALGTARSYKAVGLLPGTTYTFRIRTQNAIANSEPIIQQVQTPLQ